MQFVEVVADAQHDGDGAEPAEDATDPEGVGDRLAEPVLLRDLEVRAGCPVPADLDLVDDVVGALHGGPALRAGLHPVSGAGSPHDGRGGARRVRETLRVDVVQGDGHQAPELRERAQIGHHVAGELHAARTDDRDSDHERERSIYASNEQVRALPERERVRGHRLRRPACRQAGTLERIWRAPWKVRVPARHGDQTVVTRTPASASPARMPGSAARSVILSATTTTERARSISARFVWASTS